MKHSLLTLVYIFFFTALGAQPIFSVSPNPAEQTFRIDPTRSELVLDLRAEIKNTGPDTLRLIWRRYEMDGPAAWLTQVCDGVACYDPGVSSNFDPEDGYTAPVVVAPGSIFTLVLHVLPNGSEGAGVYDLDFSLLEDPDDVLETVVLRAIVENKAAARLSPAVAARQIRLFPNPATEYIELTDSRVVDQLVIYNVLGRVVRKFNVTDGKRYYLTGLPDGMYLVSLVNNQEGILRTMRLSKRSFRP